MFKDKQSPGVCGVEAEVLLYARSPGKALHTYIYIYVYLAVLRGVQIANVVFALLICC